MTLAGCATAPPYNPFQMPEDQFRASVKRVVLVPIAVPPQLGVSAAAMRGFDGLIEAKLQEAGFTTFPSQRWTEVLARKQKEVGGVFDAQTGRLDEAKVKTAWARAGEEIRATFHFDALVLPSVQVVKADWRAASASWDGVSEMLASGLGVLFGPNAFGTLPALTLVVSIGGPDLDKPTKYRNRAGIQVLEKLTPITERFSGKIFAPVPRDELLSNEERNRAAVELAFRPLLKKP